jgi:hypothetical protein
LLAPASKQDGAANVPVIPVLSYCPMVEQPFGKTDIATPQSLPGVWENPACMKNNVDKMSNNFFI